MVVRLSKRHEELDVQRGTSPDQMRAELEEYQATLNRFAEQVHSYVRAGGYMDRAAAKLRRAAPKVAGIVETVLRTRTTRRGHELISYMDLFGIVAAHGSGTTREFFDTFYAVANLALDQAIGMLDAGLWPPELPPPVLQIRDKELRERCGDLLGAPDNYDRVIREATTILEDRLRGKPPSELLAQLIPNAADQRGERLINRLCNPDKPVV